MRDLLLNGKPLFRYILEDYILKVGYPVYSLWRESSGVFFMNSFPFPSKQVFYGTLNNRKHLNADPAPRN
jgi:hypothetical protein